MAICTLCGMIFTSETDHDYKICVKRCQEIYIDTHEKALRACQALNQATEIYRHNSRAVTFKG